MNRIFIVTGSAGFVGNNVVRQLLDKGERVRAVYYEKKLDFKALGYGGDIEYFHADVRDINTLRPVFENAGGADIYVVHTAAVVTIMDTRKSKRALKEVNVGGAKNIIEACLQYKVKRLVYVSSVHAIPEKEESPIAEVESFDPGIVHGAYAKSKAEAAQLVVDAIKQKGLNAVIVHPAGITGPNDYSNTHLTHMAAVYYKKGLPALPKGGYNFVDVRDVAWGIIAAADKGRTGECYLLSNENYSIKEMFSYLSEICKKKPIKAQLPTWLIKCVAPFSEIFYKISGRSPLFTKYSIYTLNTNADFTYEKAARELGYKPRGLKESLADTVEFLKREGA